MAYADRTQVPFTKTVSDIMAMLRKRGAAQVGQMEEDRRLTVLFALADRQVRFRIEGEASPASQRQRARALLLVIKAKLKSIDSGVETFEQAFLANVVLSDGATLYERMQEPIALEYQTGAPSVMLLTGPRA